MKRIRDLGRLFGTLARWQCHTWLPGYLAQRRRVVSPDSEKPIDVIFLVVDHFEPSRRDGAAGVRKVRQWCEQYAEVASLHRDSDGVMPQHSWFYRYDYPNLECIQILSEYVFRGYGEIDFHLHHGNDTSDSFERTIVEGVSWFNRFGAMISAEADPRRRFGYIAGNWALDNGRRDPAMSGVNNELEILGRLGCFADFTFPAFGVNAQPKTVNSIYYVTDTPAPKSYDTGVSVARGAGRSGDLMLFTGPMYVDWKNGRVEYAAFETFAPYYSDRIDYWMRAGVQVQGQPQWVFVKLHTHGMQSAETFLGPQLGQLFSQLEDYCGKRGYRLHYVTAREAYNIVKAAEAGHVGDAGKYRDFEVAPPANRMICGNTPWVLREYSEQRLHLGVEAAAGGVRLEFRDKPLVKLEGPVIAAVDCRFEKGKIKSLAVEGSGEARIGLRGPGSGDIGVRSVQLPYKGTFG